MARYQVQSTHTPEECLKTLDDIVAQGPDTLPKWDFGCAAGDHSNHIAYSVIEAADEGSARQMLPAGLRSGALITEVAKVTPEQVRSYHQ